MKFSSDRLRMPSPFPVPDLFLTHINLGLGSNEGVGALAELFSGLEQLPAVTDRSRLWNDLLERQKAGPVAFNALVALPHARSAGVSEILMVAGRHATGIAFDAEHPNIRLVFLIVTPKDQAAAYLQKVATLARALRQPDRIAALLAAANGDDFQRILAGDAVPS
ncbi:MAG: PTS sugar transporter subunit IIA [Opitutaceae bacterium]